MKIVITIEDAEKGVHVSAVVTHNRISADVTSSVASHMASWFFHTLRGQHLKRLLNWTNFNDFFETDGSYRRRHHRVQDGGAK